MGTTKDMRFDFLCIGYQYCDQINPKFAFTIENANIVQVMGNNTSTFSKNDFNVLNATSEELHISNITVPIRGEFLGKTHLEVNLLKYEKGWIHRINVKRIESEWDLLFQGQISWTFSFINYNIPSLRIHNYCLKMSCKITTKVIPKN